ncbi:MAG TPA: alpha/beta hydrolase [Spirochaetes bacterium]|nr:alpha/beta hydrolase [Spirochaetota bacterium]
MSYEEYTEPDVRVREYYLKVSDGVSLKMVDFTPPEDGPRKPAIVFVAGWISMISGWKGVLRAITPRYRTLYLETREKASSILPEERGVSFAMDRLSADLEEVIAQAVPPKKDFFMAGSSLGATAIMEYLLTEGRKPLAAMLIAPNAEFRFPPVLGHIVPALHPSMYLAVKPLIKWYLKNFRIDSKNEPEQMKKYETTLDAADPYKLKPNAIALRNYSIRDRLQGIGTPVMIVGALTDKLHGREVLEEMTRKMTRTTYRELASNKETHSEKAGELMVNFIKNRDYMEL